MELHTDYRKDWRNDEEFAKDILESHVIEKQIIHMYAKHLELTLNKSVTIKDNGTDNTGKVVDSANTNADYLVNDIPVEVKFNNDMDDEFRFKKDQLNSYVKQGAYVLWVNGWAEKDREPVFTLISPTKMKEIASTRRAKPFQTWGYKMCYELRSYMFKWKKFREE